MSLLTRFESRTTFLAFKSLHFQKAKLKLLFLNYFGEYAGLKEIRKYLNNAFNALKDPVLLAKC